MFDIFMEKNVVGNAEVKKEGLYYCFRCRCFPPEAGIHRIYVTDGENWEDLGICVPVENAFILSRRIPIKHFKTDTFTFTLVPKEKKERAIPVKEDMPFEYLDQLDDARLVTNDTQTEIMIDSVQDQQDSDRNQESLNKWEPQ